MKRWGIGLGVLLLGLGLVLSWWVRRPAPETELGEVRPPGWWVLDSRRLVPDRELQGRELSLPYARSAGPPAADEGVLFAAPEQVAPGWNLVTSGHGPEVLLLDAEGSAGWRWRMPYERAFPGFPVDIETGSFRRARLLDDGSIIGLYQGGGLVRLAPDSSLLWAQPGGFYNDVRLTEGGRLFSLLKEVSERSLPEREEAFLEDSVVELDPATGEILQRWSLLEPLLASDWSELVHQSAGVRADILHSNTVQLISWTPDLASDEPPRDYLLVSLREIDSLVLLDPSTGEVDRLLRGGWRRQHEPVVLPDGRWLLFDNRGGTAGSSRVLWIDPEQGQVVDQLPPRDGWSLRSSQAGSVQPLANGNLLVTSSYEGTALEINPQGEIVWHWVSPFRHGDLGEYQAVLFEIARVDWPAGLTASLPASTGD